MRPYMTRTNENPLASTFKGPAPSISRRGLVAIVASMIVTSLLPGLGFALGTVGHLSQLNAANNLGFRDIQ